MEHEIRQAEQTDVVPSEPSANSATPSSTETSKCLTFPICEARIHAWETKNPAWTESVLWQQLSDFVHITCADCHAQSERVARHAVLLLQAWRQESTRHPKTKKIYSQQMPLSNLVSNNSLDAWILMVGWLHNIMDDIGEEAKSTTRHLALRSFLTDVLQLSELEHDLVMRLITHVSFSYEVELRCAKLHKLNRHDDEDDVTEIDNRATNTNITIGEQLPSAAPHKLNRHDDGDDVTEIDNRATNTSITVDEHLPSAARAAEKANMDETKTSVSTSTTIHTTSRDMTDEAQEHRMKQIQHIQIDWVALLGDAGAIVRGCVSDATKLDDLGQIGFNRAQISARCRKLFKQPIGTTPAFEGADPSSFSARLASEEFIIMGDVLKQGRQALFHMEQAGFFVTPSGHKQATEALKMLHTSIGLYSELLLPGMQMINEVDRRVHRVGKAITPEEFYRSHAEDSHEFYRLLTKKRLDAYQLNDVAYIGGSRGKIAPAQLFDMHDAEREASDLVQHSHLALYSTRDSAHIESIAAVATSAAPANQNQDVSDLCSSNHAHDADHT